VVGFVHIYVYVCIDAQWKVLHHYSIRRESCGMSQQYSNLSCH